MRFIGNNHALHFGGVTFVNRVALLQYMTDEMTRFGKTTEQQAEIVRFMNDCVDQMEDELRQELREKHYHSDLKMPSDKAGQAPS